MIYVYRCAEHGAFEKEKPMTEAGEDETCPRCGAGVRRIFTTAPIIYRADGFHSTDYTRHGSKLDALNKKWSAWAGGEEPPAPAKDDISPDDLI